MNESTKRTTVESLAKGIKMFDQQLLRSVLTDDVVWSLPGNSLISGEAHGVEAVISRAETLHNYNVKIGLEHVVFGFRDVAIILHNTGQYAGKQLDEHLITVCTLKGEQIQRMDTFLSDVAMADGYFV